MRKGTDDLFYWREYNSNYNTWELTFPEAENSNAETGKDSSSKSSNKAGAFVLRGFINNPTLKVSTSNSFDSDRFKGLGDAVDRVWKPLQSQAVVEESVGNDLVAGLLVGGLFQRNKGFGDIVKGALAGAAIEAVSDGLAGLAGINKTDYIAASPIVATDFVKVFTGSKSELSGLLSLETVIPYDPSDSEFSNLRQLAHEIHRRSTGQLRKNVKVVEDLVGFQGSPNGYVSDITKTLGVIQGSEMKGTFTLRLQGATLRNLLVKGIGIEFSKKKVMTSPGVISDQPAYIKVNITLEPAGCVTSEDVQYILSNL